MSTRARLLLTLGLTALPLAFISAGLLSHVYGLLALSTGLIFIFWCLRERIHFIMLVFLVVVFAATIASQPRPNVIVWNTAADGAGPLIESWAAKGPFNETLPIVLHVVLDAMMSPGAISDELPGGVEAQRGLYDLGDRHGLRTHDSVYSRDYFTANSLPSLMGNDYRAFARSHPGIGGNKVEDNAYFDDMAARGYRTIVFQTSHIDFCSNANVVACETLNSYDPGGEGYGGLNLRSRTLNLWHTLLRAYEPSYASIYGTRLLRRFYGLGTREVGVIGVFGEVDRFDVQRFPDWFERFMSFAEQAPRGTHVFAHFMAPHAPYLLTGDCVVSGRFHTGNHLGLQYPVEVERERARLRYYSEYLAQLNCVRRYVDDLLRTIGQAERFRDATVILHGDHGSRISVGNLIEDYGPQDFIDNYATYFAIKTPGVEPGIDCELVPLPEIFRRYLSPEPVDAVSGASPSPVIVSSREREGAWVEAPMPPFGCAVEGE